MASFWSVRGLGWNEHLNTGFPFSQVQNWSLHHEVLTIILAAIHHNVNFVDSRFPCWFDKEKPPFFRLQNFGLPTTHSVQLMDAVFHNNSFLSRLGWRLTAKAAFGMIQHTAKWDNSCATGTIALWEHFRVWESLEWSPIPIALKSLKILE